MGNTMCRLTKSAIILHSFFSTTQAARSSREEGDTFFLQF